MNNFSEQLNKQMAYKAISQNKLSLLIGVKKETISKWLSGKSEPCLSTLMQICRILDVDPDYMLGYDEIKLNK